MSGTSFIKSTKLQAHGSGQSRRQVPAKAVRIPLTIDSLAAVSKGVVTEDNVAVKGAQAGEVVGDYVWTRAKISDTSDITSMTL